MPPAMNRDSDIPDNISKESHLLSGEPSHITNNRNICDTSISEESPLPAGEPSHIPTTETDLTQVRVTPLQSPANRTPLQLPANKLQTCN